MCVFMILCILFPSREELSRELQSAVKAISDLEMSVVLILSLLHTHTYIHVHTCMQGEGERKGDNEDGI